MIAEWVRLTEEKQAGDAAQLAPHQRKAGQQPGGINAATRELGIDRTQAQRAVMTASASSEARIATTGGFSDSSLPKINQCKDHIINIATFRRLVAAATRATMQAQ